MKLLFITAKIPWGQGEAFILEEMLEIKRQGVDFLIIPRSSTKEVFHKEAERLLENAIWLPLINIEMLINLLKTLLTKISFWKILVTFIKHSRNPWIFIKNLIVSPKGIFIAKIIQKEKVKHIYAHWGSTPSTMGYIVSQITGIPWSFTLHRWDITENNLLKEKVKSATFVRVISEYGKREVVGIVGEELQDKIKIIHMGVFLPNEEQITKKIYLNKRNYIIACVANLVEVKGHKYLIEACKILKDKKINFQCWIIGEGPERKNIENQIIKLGLQKEVMVIGPKPHDEIIQMYEQNKIDITVLPSVNTVTREKEGIGVALMEAMAHRVPVIGTNVGGIPELLGEGAGILVEEKRPEQLAEAIDTIIQDEALANELRNRGYEKICKEFDIAKNSKLLSKLIMCEGNIYEQL